jgi:hypothetical protein
MERHRYVVLLNDYQAPSDSQYKASKADDTLASLEASIQAPRDVHNGTQRSFSKSIWSASWIKAVTLTHQMTGVAQQGGIYLLVRK